MSICEERVWLESASVKRGCPLLPPSHMSLHAQRASGLPTLQRQTLPYLFGGLAVPEGVASLLGHNSRDAGCHPPALRLGFRAAVAFLGTPVVQRTGDASSPAPMGSVDR